MANPFGVVEQVIQYGFNWTRSLRITSANIVYGDPVNDDSDVGDLLYWTDPVPHKINLTKGNVVGKLKSWNLYLPQTVTVPSITNFTFNDFAGDIVYQLGIVIPDNTNREAIITSIAEALNANSDSPVTAVACDCSLQLFEKVSGQLWTLETDAPQILVSPDNWYGNILIDRFFDRCKYPPLQAPQPTFEQDTDYEPNYVQKKVFQFRLEYIYDDREDSALGVWSQIPINNLGCDGTSDVAYNYIDINFNDPLLVDPAVLVLLKKVRLVARELNTGKDRSVIDLEPCEFLDYANGNFYAHFNFYNDIISSPVDDVTAAKLFDDVPLESGAEIFKENRLVEGNCLTGYNPLACIDAKYQMEFGGNPNPKLYKITGLIRVFNYRLDNNSSLPPEETKPNILEGRGAISYDTAMTYGDVAYPFFGGYFEANSVLQINSDFAFNKKRQYLPEGGWPVYAAGTNYFTISKQINKNNVVQRADGSFDISTGVNKDLVVDLYDKDEADVFSTFELQVPPGEYVIRLASHWCSFDDKLGKGFMYNLSTSKSFQKTSTYVWGIDDTPMGGQYRYDYEMKVTVTNSDVYIGEFYVADLVFPNLSDDARIYPSHSGYLYDNFGRTDVASLAQGVTVDRARVRNTVFNESDIYASYQQKNTDHNGFFFTFPDVDFNNELVYANRFLAIQVNGDIHNGGTQYYEDPTGLSALQLLQNQTITTGYPHDPIPSHLEIILPTDNPSGRLESSTFVTGTVTDTIGGVISGVTVLITHGRYGVTANNGTYNVLIWGDMSKTPPFQAPVNTRQDYIVFSLGVACGALYPNGQEVYFSIDGSVNPALGFGANTTTTPPPYSPTAVYNAGTFIIDETGTPAIKARKRGGNYTDAIRLYDGGGRVCSPVKAYEIYVPAVTEDIGKYNIQDFNGATYPANTFLYGKPSIKWILAPTTVFPAWVKTFQWMRTKNSIYGRYLQWVANQVTYLSAIAQPEIPEIQTSFQNGDAVAIKISLKNIVDYAAQNPASTIGYTYQAGDRLRLMYDRQLNPINGLNDFEITTFDSTTQSIILKNEGFPQEIQSGTVLEIFNPKSVATEDEQIYYEVGEVVNVNNGIPETFSGVFTNGDTYWRGRLITVNDEATKFASAYPVVIEDASVSDFYSSQAQDIGRIGVIDDNFRQVRRPMLLKASNTFIPATAINGLSSFEALNEKELDRSNGRIERLVSVNQTIVAISSQREVSNYIQVVNIQTADANSGILSITDKFFGNDYPHTKTLGTNLAGSVFVNDGVIFGFHSVRSDAWRYQGDGEQAISDVKMKSYFQDLAKNGVSDAIAVFDRYYEEYILTAWRNYIYEAVAASVSTIARVGTFVGIVYPADGFIPELNSTATIQYQSGGVTITRTGEVTQLATVTDGVMVTIKIAQDTTLQNGVAVSVGYSLPETIAWFNGNDTMQKQRWVTLYDFTPENYCQLGSEIVSFKDGQVWIHDKNPLRNNFYGVQYKTQVTIVPNEEPDATKNWYAVYLEAVQNGAFRWSVPVVRNSLPQLSRILRNIFEKKEEYFWAMFKRDLNTAGVAVPIINGRQLRSSSIEMQMENDSTEEILLRDIICEYDISQRL